MSCIRILAVLVVALMAYVPASARQQQSPADLESAAKQAAQAGRVQEAFDIYVRAVQALPDPPPLDDDVRLRSQVMTLGLQLPVRPPAPKEAERSSVRGQVLVRDAKDRDGFERAQAELRKAVRAAPWMPDFAYNLALAQEKLEHYRTAAANLNVYLLSKPKDGTEVTAKVYEFELKREDRLTAEAEDCEAGSLFQCDAYLHDFVFAAFNHQPDPTTTQTVRARKAYDFASGACAAGRATGCGVAGTWLEGSLGTELGLTRNDDAGFDLIFKGCRANDRGSCERLYAAVVVNADAIVEYATFRQIKSLRREKESERDRALALLTKSGETSAWACAFLGLLYELGSDHGAFKKDLAVAQSWFTKAAASAKPACGRDSASDCAVLAWLYRGDHFGRHFAALGTDQAVAASYYQRACDLQIDDGGEACRKAAELRPKTQE